MAWTKYQIILGVVMVITGSLNTLTTKWADKLSAAGSDGVVRQFDHPFLQSSTMFLGEIYCLLAFKLILFYQIYKQRQGNSYEESTATRGNQEFNPMIFLPPALCDMVATSLMYIGLNLTHASSFQMLRGSVIVFVALLSMAFLERQLVWKHWTGISLIVLGLFLVGWADIMHSGQDTDINGTITGDLLIIMAQIITAMQMVYEEKYVNSKDINPLQAVGWEGTFGFLALALLHIPFYYWKVPPPFSNNSRGTLEDIPDAFVQMSNNKLIIVALIGTVVSIAFFNFAGISVTKELSATTRMVLDSVRTLIIWAVSLALSWQEFHLLQVLGFFFLIQGMCVYNDLLPSFASLRRRLRNDEDPLISQPPDQP
ncbi:solute carrier family 35 member F6-like [Macrosteles quadrilineatus]|uniref:solute carrier family 35 member F6-like n=1 Tax=Macrosteles quadrilineatus TaxID=74068 RepID=UPI0023E2FE57|nr:solute carrier family 35 member F6-like [Macrosteles quadrilineatus]XP_054267778.1 solute carrier family 35 member F6-like [Macrosteles quadrilineatus]